MDGPILRSLRRIGVAMLATPRWVVALFVLGHGYWIWSLSSLEREGQPDPNLFWRFCANLVHAPLFGILALLVAPLFLRPRPGGGVPPLGARGWLIFLVVLVYAVVDEWHQSYVPGRDASVLDVVTDAVGAACVLWVIGYLGRVRSERGPGEPEPSVDQGVGGKGSTGSTGSEGGLLRRLGMASVLCMGAALAASLF